MNPSEVLSIFLFVQMVDFGLGQAACGTSVDVAFLVSADGSRSTEEYAQQKDFVVDLAERLGIGPGPSQGAIVLYSDSASVMAGLRRYDTKDEFERAVYDLPSQRGTRRRFDEALRVATTELYKRGRKFVPKVVLLISTGYLSSDVYALTDVSQGLRNNGAYILAVGIGQPDLVNQLLSVTDADDVFMMNDFRELMPNLGRITGRACFLIEKCASNPCLNGATCVNDAGTYNCDCKRGFSGRNCETNVDDCASVTCRNGGTCVDLVADYRCDCPVGYHGKNCEQGEGCASLTTGTKAFDKDIEFDNMRWFETPSVVHDGADGYQVLGRIVHMDYIREHLKNKKNVNLDDNQESSNNIQLTIMADTVYVKGTVKMRGMKKLTIFSRKIAFVNGSQLDLSAPNLTQTFSSVLPAGANGVDGKHGANGPTVKLYADLLEGYVNILLSGGNGLGGQNGANGKIGTDHSSHQQADRNPSECGNGRTKWGCTMLFRGRRGKQGGNGGNGGDAGRSGNGGNAGSLTLHVRTVQGKAVMKSCPGKGGPAAVNGKGGTGGQGGSGGRGVKCKNEQECSGGVIYHKCPDQCVPNGYTSPASGGSRGSNGIDGRVGVAGSDGSVLALRKSSLGRREMEKYPLPLLNLMTRYAEDLIWANKIKSSEAVLNFIIQLTEGIADASHLRKVAKRRLAFLNKKGFDRFGNNELFAPLMKWETMKKGMETIKDRAKSYEDTYNSLETSIQEEISELRKVVPLATLIQVRREKERLVESRRIAISEKGAYVAAIGELEASMNSSLESIDGLVSGVYEKSKFNKGDFFVVLQGITGFLKEVKGGDPLAAINEALGVIGHFTTKCNTGTLQSIKNKISKWMTFGKAYTALKDSNELDFDQMDVTAVPEMMKANLEMNKEGLAADLVCMLEERSLPHNKAELEAQIERFFIAGSARIDLIAKVIDLDNDIGGFNFDIRNLNDTANDIQKLIDSSDADSPIEDSVKQMFLDDLLTSYKEIETRFAKHLYQFYKSYEFRSLWDLNDRITEFQRRASEAAKGTGKLQGVVELTEAMNEIDKIELKGQKCFTSLPYKIDTHKWSFDNVKDKVMFSEIHQGKTKFDLKISDSCEHCYNARLLKMYVELYGDNTQTGNYPAKVYLKLRHMSGSHFRDGNGNVREFRQKLGFFRTFEFNRFAITNTTKCNEETKKDNRDSLYCMPKTDRRLQSMCCHFLSDFQCDDTLLGAVECQSPFGTYELSIPIDDKLPCTTSSTEITDQNCKDFDRSQFTKMNVWISFIHWTGNYPTGPDDVKCSTALVKSEKTPIKSSVQA